MGDNKWMNKSSFSEMSNDSLVFYLSDNRINGHYTMVTENPEEEGFTKLDIHLADRTKMNNADYYPSPIIKDSLNINDGLVFISERLNRDDN